MSEEALNTYYDNLGATLGETLITPTRIYVKALKSVKEAGVTVKGCSHITGGGFYENIPRALPEGMSAKIYKDELEIPGIFKLLMKEGNIPERDMFNTYNMGTGMTVVVPKEDAARAVEIIEAAGEHAKVIGEIVKSSEGVIIE